MIPQPAILPRVEATPQAESPEEAILHRNISDLASWASANEKDARNDRIRYWSLKVPAILGSASTAALQAFDLKGTVIVLGSVSAACVAFDAVFPGGHLYNVHRRASNEIWMLRDKVKTGWDRIQLTYGDKHSDERTNDLLKLIDLVEKESSRINAYVTDAETALGKEKEPGNAGG